MSETPTTLVSRRSYVGRDATAIREWVISRIVELTDQWTDFNESDAGVALIEVMSGVADMLGFYLDQSALESYLPTVLQRKNMIGITRLVGYKLDLMLPSKVPVIFNLQTTQQFDVIIPRGTAVTTSGTSRIPFVTLEEQVFHPGEWELTIPCAQYMLIQSQVTVEQVYSTGRIVINDTAVALNSVRVIVQDREWTEVENVLFSRSPFSFSVAEERNGSVSITLCRSYKENLPTEHDVPIRILYGVTEGANGNVRERAITTLVSDVFDIKGTSVKRLITVRNDEKSTGGLDRETLEHAKEHVPQEVRTMWTAVTQEDYARLSRGFPGIRRAESFDINSRIEFIQSPLVVRVYAQPYGGGNLSSELSSNLLAFLNERRSAASVLEIFSPDYRDFDLNITVFYRGDDSTEIAVRTALEMGLDSQYRTDLQDFGQRILPSDINLFARNLHPSITYLIIQTPTTPITSDRQQIPRLGNLTLTLVKEE